MTITQLAAGVMTETPDTWLQQEPMPWLEVVGIYVGLPVLLFVLISLFAVAGSWTRRSSYQPGTAWWAGPQWFGARPVEESIPAKAERPAGERGGVGARW